MNKTQNAICKIVPSGDHLQVICEKCGEACELDYKGRDPVNVLVEITCPKCGSSGEWKLDKAGLGFGDRRQAIKQPESRVCNTCGETAILDICAD